MDKKMRRLFSVVLSFAMLITTAVTNITPVQSVQAATQTQETAVKASNSYGLADNCQDGTILHCFNWTYKDIMLNFQQLHRRDLHQFRHRQHRLDVVQEHGIGYTSH